jgi:hypothetical protein
MKYQCLQDVLDNIYYDKGEFWSSDSRIYYLKEFGTLESLLEVLSKYFNMWDQGERGENYTKKLGGYTEYERASYCFLYIFQVLPMFEDPSIIPELMQYFPPEGPDQWPWTMEDMWTEVMLQNVGSYCDYGPSYIPWLMKSLHLLPKGADWAAEWFFGHMIFDAFAHIDAKTGDFPCIEEALLLGDRKIILKLAQHEVLDWQDELRKAEDTNDEIEWLETCKERLACSEYILSHLLAVPKNVVPLHAAD